MSRPETETWCAHLAAYQSTGPAVFDENFLNKHGDAVWKPGDADKRAADLLHIQITSRAASQPLLDHEGYENVVLTSLYQLFGSARDAGENRGRTLEGLRDHSPSSHYVSSLVQVDCSHRRNWCRRVFP